MLHAFRPGKRFSLLLLEDEETYISDWVASCTWPEAIDGNWQKVPSLTGRLRLCTKSLFFEPDDTRVPIVRIPFKHAKSPSATSNKAFSVVAMQVVKMKANMEDIPYIFDKDKVSTWNFELAYSNVTDVLSTLTAMVSAASMARGQQQQIWQAVARKAEDQAAFDSSRLVDFSERILFEASAAQRSPLLHETGQLVVTTQRIYFQPLHNVAGDIPVRSCLLSNIAAVVRRRSSLKPVGMEVFFVSGEHEADQWNAPSAFFSFRSEQDRERAVNVIVSSEQLGRSVQGFPAALRGMLLEANSDWLRSVTTAWQTGRISNFDYLMFINLAAGRSFNDLAQYPVFPWVLANYKSSKIDLADPASYRDLQKPIGALNPERLKTFLARYNDMPPVEQGGIPAFMYGTHYSTPGYVLYWLVRSAPAHMLRLQSGRFDAPDRLFYSIADSWDSVLSSTSDVKELIPEFYQDSPQFLLNTKRLPLGLRQGGEPVDHVDLPPWAHSPEDFLSICRQALESPYVSQNLHYWIDLIFGHKQRGQEAEEAHNVFFHVTYEGGVDTSASTSEQELRALETQINEFGQTPKQLFNQPHPPRLVCPPLGSSTPTGAHPTHTDPLRPPSGSNSLALALLHTIAAAASIFNTNQVPSTTHPSSTSSPSSVDAPLSHIVSPSRSLSPLNLPASSTLSPASHASSRSLSPALSPSQLISLQSPDLSAGTCLPPTPSTHKPQLTRYSIPAVSSSFAPSTSTSSPTLQSELEPMKRQERIASVSPQPSEEASFSGREAAGCSGPHRFSSGWSSFPHRLSPLISKKLQRDPLQCVAMSKGAVYTAGQSGVLRVLNLWDLEQIRAIRLMGDIVSLAVLPGSADPRTAGRDASKGSALQSVALAGSHNRTVYVYNVEMGRLIGEWEAHDDAVACMLVDGVVGEQIGTGARLATGSWDCSVKLWDLGEGRQPWGDVGMVGLSSLPAVELRDIDGAVWCMAMKAGGSMMVVGTEEGVVSAWDVRSQRQVWQSTVSSGDYVGGLSLSPCGNYVVTAAADGNLSLLEWRRGGAVIAAANCGQPLRCCCAHTDLAMAGGEAGEVHMWDLLQVLHKKLPEDEAPGGVKADVFGLYPPLQYSMGSAINALCVDVVAGEGVDEIACLLAAHDDGVVDVFIA